MRIVMKFGGTSVGSLEAVRNLIGIVQHAWPQHQVVVVVSAMSRVTDRLISAAREAAEGDAEAFARIKAGLLERHLDVAAALASPEDQQLLQVELAALLDYLDTLCRSIAVLGELTPRALDLFSGHGERFSARLVAAALRGAGADAVALDATGLIVTDDRFGGASPLIDQTRVRVRSGLLPLLEQARLPVVTGFIGATESGALTTLSRGGSDYSAAIIGDALDADEVWIWTDVDGVMTANPRVVGNARTLPVLSYSEMAELAYYGAKVLHPKTVLPVVQRGVPIRILNTFNAQHPGTRVSAEAIPGTAKAVTAIRDISLITVGGPGMLGLTGVAARIFAAVARVGANVLLISQASSEQNVCLGVPMSDAVAVVRELRRELAPDLSAHDVEHIDVLQPIMIVSVVGAGMRGTPGIAARVFGALGEAGINVIAIAQGSTEHNISLVVGEADGDQAVRAIHAAFGMGEQ